MPEAGRLRHFRFPDIERLVLSNGLPIYFAKMEGLPVSTFSLLLPSGALREEPSKAGLATLTGALLESGTEDLSAEEISSRLEGLGVRLHVGASWEVAHVDFTALTSKVKDASELVARLVKSPAFPVAEVERMKNHQVAAILQRRAEPRGFANELASRYIFADESPFARPLSGTTESVGSFVSDDVRAYHSACYSPHGAALVVAGAIDAEAVLENAERCFGAWEGPQLPRIAPVTKPRAEGLQAIIIERRGAVQSEIRIGHIGVARNTPDFFALTVMNTILGGAFSSRLNMNLREKHGFTYGVRSTFVMRRSPGPFLVSTAVQTEVTGAALREIIAELERIREGDVTKSELEDAKQFVAGTFPLPLQTTDGVASRLAELFVYDLPDSYLDEFPERTLSVDVAEVRRAANDHIHPDRLAILVLGDPEAVKPQLESLGISAVQVVRQEDVP